MLVPVDFNGNELTKSYGSSSADTVSLVQEPNDTESLESKIRSAFNGRPLTTKELLVKLNLNWTTQKLKSYLKKLDFIEVVKEKKMNLYKLKGTTETKQASLFV